PGEPAGARPLVRDVALEQAAGDQDGEGATIVGGAREERLVLGGHRRAACEPGQPGRVWSPVWRSSRASGPVRTAASTVSPLRGSANWTAARRRPAAPSSSRYSLTVRSRPA